MNFKITISVINAILSFMAMSGNSAVLITLWKTSSLHSVANILLASLAVSDLAVGFVVQPLAIAVVLNGNNTALLCVEMLGSILAFASLFTITAIAVDRLLALQLHLRYKAVVTPFRVTWIVILMWVSSGIFASTKLWISDLSNAALSSMIIIFLAGNFAVYLKIYLIVRRHQRQIQHHQQSQQQQQQQANNWNIFNVTRFRKSALNTFLVYILLLCCYAPYSLSAQLKFAGVVISSNAFVTAFTLIYLNSSLNPFLYCWRDRDIRAAMKHLFCR